MGSLDWKTGWDAGDDAEGWAVIWPSPHGGPIVAYIGERVDARPSHDAQWAWLHSPFAGQPWIPSRGMRGPPR